jgi:aspartate/methionine/tyrosine aminotransferase
VAAARFAEAMGHANFRGMSLPRFGHIAYAKSEPPRLRLSLAESGVASPDLAALGMPDQAPVPSDPEPVLEPLGRALGARVQAPGGRVLVTAGASEAIVATFLGLSDEGEALVESFGYEPHRLTPPALRIPCRAFERGRGAAGVAREIERALGPATRVVMVSDLHNPTGRPLDPGDVEALDRLAAARSLWIICDETFRDAAERPLGTLARRSDRWVTISSLTKVYGLGGLRIGWIAGSPEALDLCQNALNGLSANASLPAAAFALELMPHLDRLRARTHAILRENHARWRAFAAGRPGVDPNPSGTTTWFAWDREGAGDAFSSFAAARFDLAVTPGRFFGDSSGVRVALGGEPAKFTAALDQFERAAQAFDPASAMTLEETS